MADTGPGKPEHPDNCVIDIAAGLCLAAMAVFALFWLIPVNVEPGTSSNDVGPGFFPKLACWIVLGLSLALVVLKIRRYRKDHPQVRGMPILNELIIWIVLSIITIFAFINLGFLAIAPALIASAALFAGYRKIKVIAALAVVFPVIIDQMAWLIFVVDLP